MSKNVLSIVERQTENAQWPIDCALKRIEEFDEIFIVAKHKGSDSYSRFSSGLKSIFWWVGALEAMKREVMNEGLNTLE